MICWVTWIPLFVLMRSRVVEQWSIPNAVCSFPVLEKSNLALDIATSEYYCFFLCRYTVYCDVVFLHASSAAAVPPLVTFSLNFPPTKLFYIGTNECMPLPPTYTLYDLNRLSRSSPGRSTCQPHNAGRSFQNKKKHI